MDQIFKYTRSIPDYAFPLMEKYFPGAITFIFQSAGEVWTTPLEKGKTIGVRIPRLNPLLELLAYINLPILNTSANVSGKKPIEEEKNLRNVLSGGFLYFPFEYNVTMQNIPSTIVDCTDDWPVVLRKGAVEI
jgi:L-threonylcarbamoyladenylate synthase